MYEKRASPQMNVMKTDSRVMESGNTGDYIHLSHSKRSCDGKPYRVVAVGFALLCVIQAALNIGLRLYTFSNKNLARERDELQIRYDTLAREKAELQIRYDNLARERDQKQIGYDILARERDQKQIGLDNLARERDELQIRYDNLARERDQTKASSTILSVKADQYKTKLIDIYYYSEEHWVYFSSSFYFISTPEKTWQESREDCLSRKADLVVINSRAEQEFLMKLKDSFWIGLSDLQREGTWVWVDGTPITISSWADGEPNSYTGINEDCGEVRENHPLDKSWNDLPCSSAEAWICERNNLFLDL